MLAALLALVTAISLIPSDFWFIRALDTIRQPLVFVGMALMVLALIFGGGRRWLAAALSALVVVLNLSRVYPYLFFAEPQVALAEPIDGSCFSALAVNVKVKNKDYAGILRQIERVDPDVLLLMETDEVWVRELRPALAAYPHVNSHPQAEAFGMVFATRLPVVKSRMVENTHRDTPTLYATLRAPDAGLFEFIGLHPKPPLPGWDTEKRDRNIINAGTQTPDRLPDAVVMGDFNDVPWSRTVTRFREASDWRDPRIGRGTYPTFPADYLWLGWPLDQLMVKGGIGIRSFRVMPDNGSDHRAMLGEFCLDQTPAGSPSGS